MNEFAPSTLSTPLALVTGATSGIGRAAAIKLAADGFEVLVHGRDAQRGAEVVEQIRKTGGSARFFAADLSDLDALGALAEAAAEAQVLVNNAGFGWFGPTAELEPAAFDEMFAANVRAAYYLTAALAPRMAARGKGSVVNVGSVGGQIGLPGSAAYSATKAALASLTRTWAAEFSPAGVRVNTVSPGPTRTAADPEVIAMLGRTTLFARAAEAAEIAETIAFLASDSSSYVTGSLLAVDAGRTAV
jgi:NAD(P)-dependent dehydrogenase (short-subunit alcohol dehydrogenase family)